MEIKFKTKDTDARQINYDMPEDLAGLTAKFGDDSVYKAASGAFVISLQALARRHIEKSDAEIQALANDYNPSERASAVKLSPLERAQKALGGLSAEDKAELMAQLKARK